LIEQPRIHVKQEDRAGNESLVRCCTSTELAGVERDRAIREAELADRFVVVWTEPAPPDCGHP